MVFKRFMSFVDKSPSGCWLWKGGGTPGGYGRFWVNGKTVSPHRWHYEHVHGKIPPGLNVCHTCDTPACVNIEHLFAATQSENIKDALRKGRKPTGPIKTHCLRGHEYTKDNTYTSPNRPRRRICKQCWQVRRENKLIANTGS